MGSGEAVSPGRDVLALEKQLDACAQASLGSLTREERSARAAALVRVTTKMNALRVANFQACEEAEVGALTDQRNTANHLAQVTGCDPASVRADMRLGDWLVELPVLAEAFAAGRLTADHLHKLRLADNPRVHQQLITNQGRFVRWFTMCQFRDLDKVIERWLLGADPDGAAPDEQAKHTGLTMTPIPGGMSKVRGVLDPLQTAALNGAIAAEARALRAREQEEGRTSTVRQRTLNALLNLVGRGEARPDGTFARPRVNIVMSQSVHDKTLAWLADPTKNKFPEIDFEDPDKLCQLIDGTPIHPLYAIFASATAKFRRTVYSARGRPIEASFDTRAIPDWMREIALITSNGACANPVCDAPFGWLHGDHITPWSHTKDTSVANTRMLCEPDNLWRGNDTDRGQWGQDAA